MNAPENPFHAMRQVLNEIEQFFDRQAARHDVEHLGGPQGRVICLLMKREEDTSFSDIERNLSSSKSVTSNLIRRMVRNGFVTVVPSAQDKRVKHVVLTEFGREKGVKLQQFLAYIEQTLTLGITPEDFQATRRVMIRLQENIQREGAKHD